MDTECGYFQMTFVLFLILPYQRGVISVTILKSLLFLNCEYDIQIKSSFYFFPLYKPWLCD